jgi:hypothetical protein
MSKRSNAQDKRRQVRRALNSAPEFFGRLGNSRARNIGYGSGLSSSYIKDTSKRKYNDHLGDN